MKILVTGATGFIGKHLVKSLSNKYKIRCFIRKESKKKDITFLENCGAKMVYGDVHNKKSLLKAMKNVDAVFHLAGGGKVETTFKKGFDELKKLNIDSTKNVIETAVESKVKKFVHFSSISAIGIIVERKINENTSCIPKTPHEVCKLETEKIMEKYKDKILITIIRPGIVYGPDGMNSEIIQVSNILKKHLFVIPGNGKNIMPWIYVDDVVNGTLIAFEKNKKSCEKFILVSEPEPTFNQLIYSVRKALGINALIIHFPKSLFRLGAYFLEKLGNTFKFAPIVNSVRAKSMTSNRIYDITKIKKLGYKQKADFDSSIKLTVDWYKKNEVI